MFAFEQTGAGFMVLHSSSKTGLPILVFSFVFNLKVAFSQFSVCGGVCVCLHFSVASVDSPEGFSRTKKRR